MSQNFAVFVPEKCHLSQKNVICPRKYNKVPEWPQKNMACMLMIKDKNQHFNQCSHEITHKINKRPKGPHIVHLSTICHLFEELAKADIVVYWSARKTQTCYRTLRSCFLSSFVEFCSAVSKEKSKMSQPIRGQGGHLVFPIGPKNTILLEDRPEKHKNLVEDIEILLPVKFRWIPFSGF